MVGFDVERHAYGAHRYPAQLVLQDVRTIHGSQFRNASLIVASSPCQEFSYRAMPWKRAKALGPPLLGMELFTQAERIQREAIEASTCWACEDWHITAYCDACKGTRRRFIPMVQENVRGAQKYVGRARWHYGSFYLWGDVPALMPITVGGVKVKAMGAGWYHPSNPRHVPGLGFNTHADRAMRADDSVKVGGARGDDWFTHHNRPEFDERATKNGGGSWFNVAHNTTSGKGQNPDGRKLAEHAISNASEGRKGYASGTGNLGKSVVSRTTSSKSSARKAASARIAKIPLPLARHIARTYYPRNFRCNGLYIAPT